MIWIGIDTGVHTGLAIWDGKGRRFLSIEELKIHRAMDVVEALAKANAREVRARVEDARQRKWIPNMGSIRNEIGRAKGAGSVERDCSIWEDFLADINVPCEMVAPKNNVTKQRQEAFANLTGWTQRTNEHERDAAMLVFGK